MPGDEESADAAPDADPESDGDDESADGDDESADELDEADEPDELESGSAHATPGVVATATPTPKATANPPTRPMYMALLIFPLSKPPIWSFDLCTYILMRANTRDVRLDLREDWICLLRLKRFVPC